MIRAYDDNGNIVRCAECKFYQRNGFYCNNDKNCNRGSGDEYAFSLNYIGMDEPLLSAEDCDNWFCADFELKEQSNE